MKIKQLVAPKNNGPEQLYALTEEGRVFALYRDSLTDMPWWEEVCTFKFGNDPINNE